MSKGSEAWTRTTIREMLEDEFPGVWGNTPSNGYGNALALRSTNIDDQGNISYETGAERQIAAKKLADKELRTGDLILEGSGGGKGKPVGRVAYFEHPRDSRSYVCSNFFRTLRPSDKVDSRFLFWRLLHFYSQPEIWHFQQQTTSIINLKHQHYLNTTLRWPELDEQRRIAKVLDTVDAAIQQTDDVIAKQQQVKKGLLQDLLTRGLDEEGRLRNPERHPEQFKESPLGRIPKDWATAPMETLLTRFRNGTSSKQIKQETPYPVARIETIASGRIDHASVRYHKSEQPGFKMQAGDILYSHINSTAHIGKVALYEGRRPLYHGMNLLILRPDRSIVEPRFLYEILASERGRAHARREARPAVNQESLTQAGVGSLVTPIPPKEEQERILNHVLSVDRRIEAERSYRSKIERLKTGLMQDLLTGRVRVPEAEEIVSEVVA